MKLGYSEILWAEHASYNSNNHYPKYRVKKKGDKMPRKAHAK